MTQLTLHVDGMGCRECVRQVTARLRDVPGVQTVTADHRRSVVLLTGSMGRDDVEAALQGTRFLIKRIAADSDRPPERSPTRRATPCEASDRTGTGKPARREFRHQHNPDGDS